MERDEKTLKEELKNLKLEKRKLLLLGKKTEKVNQRIEDIKKEIAELEKENLWVLQSNKKKRKSILNYIKIILWGVGFYDENCCM